MVYLLDQGSLIYGLITLGPALFTHTQLALPAKEREPA